MIATLRACLVVLNLILSSAVFGGAVLVAAFFRVKDRPGTPYDLSPRWWGQTHLWVAGVRVVEHGLEHKQGSQHIFVANHLGFFDVFALAASLRWMKFVAKAELFGVPILGWAMRSAGMIPVKRSNRRSAFDAYAAATHRIRAGASVAVYPEGSRGSEYALRPFKKGPFVLAIDAQAPIVPVYLYGVLEIQRTGEFKVYPGTVHLHYLPAIPTAGLTYADRDALAREAYEAMAACAEREYGVVSPPYGPGKGV
jgi:1-acyl-sn-glycerol-3-phosphate acyltransferase